MFQQTKDVLERSSSTIWKDTIGALSLLVLLVASLHLPSLL